MRSLVVLALSASAVALPLAAQTMTSPPATTSEQTASPPPGPASSGAATPLAHAGSSDTQPICKTYTPAGTHFSKKECHTRAEWDQMAADARNTLNDSAHPNPGGPH